MKLLAALAILAVLYILVVSRGGHDDRDEYPEILPW